MHIQQIVANETKEIVQKEEQQAVAKARETQEIADSAQRDLNEALPALDAALASLKSLNRNDVVEVGWSCSVSAASVWQVGGRLVQGETETWY